MSAETLLLWGAVALYAAATLAALAASVADRRAEGRILVLLAAGLAVHGVALGLRWARLGHGPFITMFEILSSNVWSLLAIYALAYWRARAVRPAAGVVLVIVSVMMAWLLLENPRAGHLPPTYDTVWLYIHVALGKVFLGCVLIAVGIGGIVLLRATEAGRRRFAALAPDDRLDELGYRFLLVALIFETLMLVAGAIWAQDAWGRYWAWDPLETWAFTTWLALVFTVHLRFAMRPSPRVNAALAMTVFAIAFLTFFGMPFVSTAPHQGAI